LVEGLKTLAGPTQVPYRLRLTWHRGLVSRDLAVKVDPRL
jgi:hypothetical protein